jgi:hypothetical protein
MLAGANAICSIQRDAKGRCQLKTGFLAPIHAPSFMRL